MHKVKVAIANKYPHYVVRVVCTCVAGKAGKCSHVIGLKSVPEDLSCTQMQQYGINHILSLSQ